MCKSSTLIFVLIFAFLFHLEKYSLRLISVISLISFGVFLMVFNTTSVSVPGVIMVFSASGLAGLRWALTELVMHKKSMGLSNPFATIFWLAPLMAVTLAVVSIPLEGWLSVFRSEHFQGTKGLLTVGVIIFPGGLAFAMVASEYLWVMTCEDRGIKLTRLQHHTAGRISPDVDCWYLQGSHHHLHLRLGFRRPAHRAEHHRCRHHRLR